MVTMFDPVSQFDMVAELRTMTSTTTKLGETIIYQTVAAERIQHAVWMGVSLQSLVLLYPKSGSMQDETLQVEWVVGRFLGLVSASRKYDDRDVAECYHLVSGLQVTTAARLLRLTAFERCSGPSMWQYSSDCTPQQFQQRWSG
eukprot:6056829-Amphidinium_carterae.1